ncbi:MAG: hypothetical protein Ct9H300mP12_13050 [Acidimicrobiales bacterium]|nr:MAG: hypothetical protein Ct9H300mP12_13050 [Acidimicrobiales bacterium]
MGDRIEALAAAGWMPWWSRLRLSSGNFEIAWDLDIEAAGRAERPEWPSSGRERSMTMTGSWKWS